MTMGRVRDIRFCTRAAATALIGLFAACSLPAAARADGRQAGAQARRGAAGVETDDMKLPPGEMPGLVMRYAVDRATLNRMFPVEYSEARRNRMKEFYGEWRQALAAMNFDAMNQEDKVDYLLLLNHLAYEERRLDLEAKNAEEALPLMPFARAIVGLEEARRRMEKVDPQKAAALLTDLGKQIAATRQGVEAGLRPEGKAPGGVAPIKVKKTVANRAVALINGLRNTLRSWAGFYNGYDPLFTWWVDVPYRSADRALQDYVAFLRERVLGLRPEPAEAAAAPAAGRGAGAEQAGGAAAGARGGRAAVTQAEPGSSADIIGDPIGHDALMAELAHEMIPYTPEELIAIADKEFEWCENEMKKAARRLGYGDDWMKALEYVKNLYVEPGRQADLIRELALEAIRFLDEHDLITIPPLARESWRIEMMSPERQLVNPFFTGGEVISVSYPTNTMTQEQKMMSMRGNNIHFARATVFHELIPGHHLAGFMTARYRTYRSLFSTSFWGEGWPLYWEMFLYDTDFPRSPENRIGMLFWRMHRCARIIFSLNFHLEKMTPQECIDFLVKRVGHEPENAIGEVRRSFGGGYGPLYQAAYMVGGLQFRALHRELVESGKMSNRAFHDAVMRENSMPVEMLRALLTNQRLTRDYKPSWRFYEVK
jgi:uncharacterized protein (DUF885 family)